MLQPSNAGSAVHAANSISHMNIILVFFDLMAIALHLKRFGYDGFVIWNDRVSPKM